jgi:hypothetical protein
MIGQAGPDWLVTHEPAKHGEDELVFLGSAICEDAGEIWRLPVEHSVNAK